MYPGVVGELVNLSQYWDRETLLSGKKEIKELHDEISAYFKTAYEQLAAAENAFAQNEELLQQKMKEEEVATFTDQFVKDIFQAAAPKERHLFAAAFTPRGPVDYQEILTEDCKFRYILKGGSRSFKSFLLDQIVQAARQKGHSMDIFHNPLNTNAISFVLLPALGIAVLDGDLYQVTENRPGDQTIDLSNCFAPFNEEEEKEYCIQMEQYKNRLAGGIEKIANAKAKHDQLETFYIRAMDDEAVDEARRQLFDQILALATAETEKK